MNEPLSLSEFIRQILGAELSETQKRILNYLQSDERAESIRALFGQLKLQEADQLNTWVRDYEAYVIRHRGDLTEVYQRIRDGLREYREEKIHAAFDARADWWHRNGQHGAVSKSYHPLYYVTDSTPEELDQLVKQFRNPSPTFPEETIREMAAGYEQAIGESDRPLVVIDSLSGVTLTGQAAVQDRKLKQASLYGSFGCPKGQMALIQSQISLGARGAEVSLLEQPTQEMAELAGIPRMRSTLRAEIREHFGIGLYRPMYSHWARQSGKTRAIQAFYQYNIGMMVKDWLSPLQPISAVSTMDFFREFWLGPRWPEYSGDVMSTKHANAPRKPKKGHKK